MQVPASILELLDNQNVTYSVTNVNNNPNLTLVKNESDTQLIKSVLVRDSQGIAQVIVPSNTILDLDAMFRQFERRFTGVPISETRQILSHSELSSVPAVPHWNNFPTYIDKGVVKQQRLNLDSGNTDQLLEVSANNFNALLEPAHTGSFTIRAPDIPSDSSDDEGIILGSIKQFTERRIKQRLEETLELPPLPETAQRIIKLRADPNADINDLTNIVEIDPSLAAQVVSWAASPYYSAPGKIKSVHDAIVRVLGFDMVLNLALGLALGKTLTMSALSREQIDDYWRNSVYTAAAVEGLVTSIAREHRPGFGMAYLSGLLNNFGYLIMAEVFPPYFESMNRLTANNPHLPRATIEQHLMGVNGELIASWLLDNWNMPQEVTVALRQQCNPKYDKNHETYAKLIYVAKNLLASNGFGDQFPQPIPKGMYEQIRLDAETADVTISNILASGEDLDEIADKMRG